MILTVEEVLELYQKEEVDFIQPALAKYWPAVIEATMTKMTGLTDATFSALDENKTGDFEEKEFLDKFMQFMDNMFTQKVLGATGMIKKIREQRAAQILTIIMDKNDDKHERPRGTGMNRITQHSLAKVRACLQATLSMHTTQLSHDYTI